MNNFLDVPELLNLVHLHLESKNTTLLRLKDMSTCLNVCSKHDRSVSTIQVNYILNSFNKWKFPFQNENVISVTILGDFEMFLVTNFLQKLPKCIKTLWAKVKNVILQSKLLRLLFGQLLENLGYFSSQHLVTLVVSTPPPLSILRNLNHYCSMS